MPGAPLAPILIGAAVGGIGAKMSGGNPLTGALLGAAGGGFSGMGGFAGLGGAGAGAAGDGLFAATGGIPAGGFGALTGIPAASAAGAAAPGLFAATGGLPPGGFAAATGIPSAAGGGSGLGSILGNASGISKYLPYASLLAGAGGTSAAPSAPAAKQDPAKVAKPSQRDEKYIDPSSYLGNTGDRKYFSEVNPEVQYYDDGGAVSPTNNNFLQQWFNRGANYVPPPVSTVMPAPQVLPSPVTTQPAPVTPATTLPTPQQQVGGTDMVNGRYNPLTNDQKTWLKTQGVTDQMLSYYKPDVTSGIGTMNYDIDRILNPQKYHVHATGYVAPSSTSPADAATTPARPSPLRSGQYVDPSIYLTGGGNRKFFDTVNPAIPVAKKRGGRISMPSGMFASNSATMARGGGMPSMPAPGQVMGGGDGQSDQIPAMLSNDEHVISAPAVSAIGRGSSAAGHRKLDMMQKKALMANYKKGKPPMGLGSMRMH